MFENNSFKSLRNHRSEDKGAWLLVSEEYASFGSKQNIAFFNGDGQVLQLREGRKIRRSIRDNSGAHTFRKMNRMLSAPGGLKTFRLKSTVPLRGVMACVPP